MSVGLLSPIFARGEVADAVSDESWVQALIEVEAALSVAAGSPSDAAAIRGLHPSVAEFDRETAETTSPLVGLVRLLREHAGPAVHAGATSQDIVDTATMLVLRRAAGPLLVDAQAASAAAAVLVRRHRDDATMGRTLLQPSMPISFGLRAARWMDGIDDACAWLRLTLAHDLAVDLGGPAGHGDPALTRALADELDLADPVLPWHSIRLRPARSAAALAALTGVLGKIARDVVILSQPEIGELSEGDPDRGRSGSVPGKNNPVAATAVTMCARRIPPLLCTVYSAMDQENERGTGGWQVEWSTTTELLRLTGSAAAWARDMLEHLQVDRDRMAQAAGQAPDLGASGELIDRALALHDERLRSTETSDAGK